MTRTAKIISIKTGEQIERTAVEICREWMGKYATGQHLTIRLRAINYASLDPRVSDFAFRLMYVESQYGDPDGSNISPSNETSAKLLRRSEREVKRGHKELAEALYYTGVRRRRNNSSVRTLSVPKDVFERIATEISALPEVTRRSLESEKGHGGHFSKSRSDKIRHPEVTPQSPYPEPYYPEVEVVVRESTGDSRLKITQPEDDLNERCIDFDKQEFENAFHDVERPHVLTMVEMRDILVADGGDGIANRACCPGLEMFTEIQKWVEAGCDFETLIRPVIRATAAAAAKRKSPVRSWSYFNLAIAKAKAQADEPLPIVKHGYAGKVQKDTNRFNDGQVEVKAGGCFVRGSDANALMDSVDGATIKQVRSVLRESTGQFNKPQVFARDFSLKEIMDWCTSELRKTLAFERYGKPEVLAGGPAARFKGDELSTPTCILSQAFIDGCAKEWPAAVRHSQFGEDQITRAMRKMTVQNYGPEIQKSVEASVRDLFRDYHQEMLRTEEMLAKEKAPPISPFDSDIPFEEEIPFRTPEPWTPRAQLVRSAEADSVEVA